MIINRVPLSRLRPTELIPLMSNQTPVRFKRSIAGLLINPIMQSGAALSTMPRPPYAYRLSETAEVALDLSSLAAKVEKSNEKRQTAYDQSRKLLVALIRARNNLEVNASNKLSEASELQQLFLSSINPTPSSSDSLRIPREANLSSRVEDYVRFQAYSHFLGTGKLIPPSACGYATDEEYLAGACMALCQDLSRYCQGRAIERDVGSVALARDLVRGVLDYLMEFDFRNGSLRRKYDGTKYSLKAIETILYELSVTGAEIPATAAPSSEDDNDRLPQSELQEIRKRMVHRDELRETLIKKCRDGQKAAKQVSILYLTYTIHQKWLESTGMQNI